MAGDENRQRLRRLTNCHILRDHKLIREDLWVRGGLVVDPEVVFYVEKNQAVHTVDCNGAMIAPGFIELQLNGGWGIDFSYNTTHVKNGISTVAKKLLEHGVTSFCPTVVTSPPETYHAVLPHIKKRQGGKEGATILGIHLEGPFINKEKKGAHPIQCIQELKKGMITLQETYGCLDDIGIVTLAPELPNSHEVIEELTRRGITVSLGHSMANLADGEKAVCSGATFITHLFNAMLPFHHRDPGLVGLLASINIPENRQVFYGIIADGTHTHPAALRIAYKTHPDGLVLVSDAISALGLEEGRHHIGQMDIDVRNGKAFVAGTDTLCGSTAALDYCVKVFHQSTGCSLEYALESASLHPAKALGLENKKGSLSFGADADFVMLNKDLKVLSTWIAGDCVYESK
ncbi:N-acetylglucosamine-6-phosphate deacetylase [Arctopsyche grandis]|uniref:N-acetylglucosamine-6-phosphate deacetylase n=1 Tax=Arctopsyche grandis TaxID=121162 RepID=UPI00406D7696